MKWKSKEEKISIKRFLQAFRKNIKEGNGLALFYYIILYDDVREQLESEGFRVRTVTSNSGGRAAYLITKKEDFVPAEKAEEMTME